MALTEVVLRCKVLAITPEGLVTLEVTTYNHPVVVIVAGLGQGFHWTANLVDAEIKDFSDAVLALEKVRRA